jgi:ferredoxin
MKLEVLLMKARVDKDDCISCGLCPSICPEVFEMEDDGKAGVVVDEVPSENEDATQEAAESCPTSAIHVEE